MMIYSLLVLVVLTATASCQLAPPGILNDLFSILYNGIVSLETCSDVQFDPANLDFTLYTQETQQNGTRLDPTNLNLINPKNRLVVIIHGWLQNGSQPWIAQMKDAYLNQAPANIIVLNWSLYATTKYCRAFCAVPRVGQSAGDFIYDLTLAGGIPLDKVQINGFSLGGHVAGYAGQQIQARSGGGKIGRIIGLDSAGPGFLGLPENQRLDAGDALVVQGIHTSNSQFGYTPAYGSVDFHLNHGFVLGCGVMQPGCPLNPGVPSKPTTTFEELLLYVFCNHVRAPVYFIESIASNSYVGVGCGSCGRFGLGLCNSEPTAVMGENCPPTAKGEIYLSTNDQAPFGKEIDGLLGKPL